MKKYLILRFRNAGLFLSKEPKDFAFDNIHKQKQARFDKKSRLGLTRFKEPIAPEHISNMLHVLFGERPVPSFRKVYHKPVDHYIQMAKESYLKIDTLRTGKEHFFHDYAPETFLLKKSVHDSWSKALNMTWIKLKLALKDHSIENPDQLYEEFIKVTKKAIGYKSIDEMTFDDLSKKMFKMFCDFPDTFHSNFNELFEKIKKQKRNSVIVYIIGRVNKKTGIRNFDLDINSQAEIVRMVNMYPEKMSKLSGYIIVPVEDDDLIKLRNTSGYATLLDGGYVTIETIIHENVLDVTDFRKVSDISSEKVIYNAKTKTNESQA